MFKIIKNKWLAGLARQKTHDSLRVNKQGGSMKNLLLCIVFGSLAACSSVDKKVQDLEAINEIRVEHVDEVLDNIPKWFADPPTSEAGLFGVGTAVSGSLQFSISKAKLQAIYNIASSYNQSVSGNQKSFSAETDGVTGSFRSRDSLIVDQLVKSSDVSGSQIDDIIMIREGTAFRTYALMFYPYSETNRVKQARQQEKMDQEVQQSLQVAHKELMQRLRDDEPSEDRTEITTNEVIAPKELAGQ
jgi:hypothetical protein